MAENFWKSSHCKEWILERADLSRDRGDDLKIFGEEEYQKIMIFYCNLIQAVGADNKLRQQIVATAMTYFRRFYVRRSLKDIDPILMAGTCVFVASKTEEFMILSTTRIANFINSYLRRYTSKPEFSLRPQFIHEAEFMLLQIIDCSLYVWHPYRSLKVLFQDLKEQSVRNVDELHSDVWMLINDSYRTDTVLLFPPFVIALACIMAAAMLRKCENDILPWLIQLHTDFEKVLDCQRVLFNFFRIDKGFKDKEVFEEIIIRIPKPDPVLKD
ncbi:unnamed protein product [Bursaphelenchus xylophilus]|uniref:(pine wood nematode) hypothetical protein n=1 Tax=Bursaphelenchus xylophilus TaxID=6326 RepID=A0A1I7SDY4_BURXY|nr:unnamed protein product [Bursaphelenchus xylophilus]CAG9100371.1 unnamed protein product [Bursaphelenchus xylophilus]